MGWMRTLLLGDIGNRLDIADTENDIRQLRSKQRRDAARLRSKNLKINELKEEIDQLKLVTQALTRFLISKGTIDESELEEFITAVDAEDGVIDGKVTPAEELPTSNLASQPRKPVIPEGTFKRPE